MRKEIWLLMEITREMRFFLGGDLSLGYQISFYKSYLGSIPFS